MKASGREGEETRREGERALAIPSLTISMREGQWTLTPNELQKLPVTAAGVQGARCGSTCDPLLHCAVNRRCCAVVRGQRSGPGGATPPAKLPGPRPTSAPPSPQVRNRGSEHAVHHCLRDVRSSSPGILTRQGWEPCIVRCVPRVAVNAAPH